MHNISKEKLINVIDSCFGSISKIDFDIIILAQPHNCSKIVKAFGDIAKPCEHGNGWTIIKYLSGLQYNIFVYVDYKRAHEDDLRIFIKTKRIPTIFGCRTFESDKFRLPISSLYK